MERRHRIALISILTMVFVGGLPLLGLAADAALTTPDGRTVVWSDWVDDNAPVAVLLWASWVPNAGTTLAEIREMRTAAQSRGLELVMVVVQEPLEEARESLGEIDVVWYHDRYGRLLKDYRVVSIPRLLVISEDGTVIERLDARPESLRVRGGD